MFLTLILFDTKTHYLFDKNRNKIGPFKKKTFIQTGKIKKYTFCVLVSLL